MFHKVLVFHVGAHQKVQRCPAALADALNGTRAAVAEGIVAGWRCCAAFRPSRQTAEDGGVVAAKMLMGQGAFGFDAASNTYVDLVEAGIIGPAKVVRVALKNTVSVAGGLLLTEATMTEVTDDNDRAAPRADLGFP